MVLDSSAIVAIMLREPGYAALLDKIDAAPVLLVGAPTLVESCMVLASRLRADPRPKLLAFLRRIEAGIVAFDQRHFDVAAEAFLRFGRGRHPAGLNFGDCLSYAVAFLAEMPLLFKGTDFSRTDILCA